MDDFDETSVTALNHTSLREAQWEFEPGMRLGTYRIVAPIAAGGFGCVYAAEDLSRGRQAAIKVLRRKWSESAEMVERFLREAQAINLIGHPNIVEIFEVGNHDGHLYLAMELLEGVPLSARVKERGALSPAEALEILGPVCEALEAAHRAGFVHRDIKPSNIVIAHADLPWRVKLIDFGVAKLIAPEVPGLTRTGVHIGTLASMAPEQILGRVVDARTDVYALGVLLHVLLTGSAPFVSHDPIAVHQMHLTNPVPRASRLAPVGLALDRVIMTAMEKAPERRFPSAARFLDELRGAVGAHGDSTGLALDGALTEPTNEGAIGLHISLALDGVTFEDADDRLLDDLDQIYDLVDDLLASGQYLVPRRTDRSILGCVLAEGSEETARRRVMTHARGLEAALDARPHADSRIHVRVTVRGGDVLLRRGASVQIVGGALLNDEHGMDSDGDTGHGNVRRRDGDGYG